MLQMVAGKNTVLYFVNLLIFGSYLHTCWKLGSFRKPKKKKLQLFVGFQGRWRGEERGGGLLLGANSSPPLLLSLCYCNGWHDLQFA